MNLPRLLVTLAVLVVLASVVPGPLSAQNGTPPEDVTFTLVVNPGAPFGSCAFPISISAQGKAKTIALRSGNLIFTSPNLNATVTYQSNETGEPEYHRFNPRDYESRWDSSGRGHRSKSID